MPQMPSEMHMPDAILQYFTGGGDEAKWDTVRGHLDAGKTAADTLGAVSAGLSFAQSSETASVTPLTVETAHASRGPFKLIVAGEGPFNTEYDPTLYLGYNVAVGGTRALAGEGAFWFAIEGHYDDSTKDTIESYWSYLHTSGSAKRPIFWQFNKADGEITAFQMRSKGVQFTHWADDAVFATVNSQGVAVTPRTGESASLSLGWVTGGQNFISVGNSTNGFLLQPIAAGNGTWEMRVGASQSFSFNVNGITLNTTSGTFVAGKDGGFSIRNAADSANIPVARNITNEMYIGSNSTWTGISFQAGGSTIYRLTPTGIGFYGATPVAKQTGVAVDAASIHAALVNLGLIAA